ncbi:MAG: FAD:protein FMN transferase [Phycisphaerae bacterium]|nr:FAD:protein FMN transferase [Phycisphaerae bacterium]MDD5381466.1 FAD:protein FMN transferase [Phycisphaerae bacterium]
MNRNSRIAIEIVVFAFLAAALYFFAPDKNAGRVDADSGMREVMGTFARVVAVAADSNTAKGCIEDAFAEIKEVEKLMNYHKSDSEISELNRDGFARAVRVSKSTYEVIEKSVRFSKLSSGAFDVTVGPLVDLWHSAEEANSLPSDAELQRVHSKVGCDKLIRDANERSVRFAAKGMRVDLGGIAKGYAIDKAVEAMQKGGAAGGMVDIGGEIRCFGSPPAGQNIWRIGLQDPVANDVMNAGKPLFILRLTDSAVATSGHYHRFVTIGGKKYSHIINPESGHSSESLASVTIICPSAADADALSTAVSVMGREKGLALIETIPDAEAILITSPPEYKVIKTSGAEKFID